MKNSKAAFTLIEIMVGAMVFGLVIGTLLLLFVGCLSLNSNSKNLTTAINGAQAKLEEIFQQDFETLVISYSDGGTPGDIFSVSGWSLTHSGIVEIIDDGSDEPENLTSSDLVQMTVTVSWQEKGGRVIGEDQNLNGVFEVATEDLNGNGRLDSPAQIVTLISRH